MVLTCVAAVAVVWLALWGLIRLEGTMGEARLPRDGSPATRQPPGHTHLWPDAAERMTRTGWYACSTAWSRSAILPAPRSPRIRSARLSLARTASASGGIRPRMP